MSHRIGAAFAVLSIMFKNLGRKFAENARTGATVNMKNVRGLGSADLNRVKSASYSGRRFGVALFC